jgi:translation initiation factor 1 (eIF-1/SUI1)
MNLVDRLLAVDAKEIKEKQTAKIEIKRLSKLVGEPFFVTVQEVDGERYQELQMELLDKKGKADYSRIYRQNTLLVLEGVVEPNLKDQELQKHFGASTPKDLAEILFQGGAMAKIADLISKVSGFDNDDEEEEEIKN